jgi:predicted RNA-binding Zn-ribbon protein involved in translation (DUF1610 family)
MAHDHEHDHLAGQLDHPQAQHVTRCSCGQELDVCTHGHCPRCGHRIARHAGRPAAARMLVGA